jgi:Skp family chaperone for outer membrane proteins
MNRRTFLSLSVFLACYPQLSFANNSYMAIGSEYPVQHVLNTRDLERLIEKLESTCQTLEKQSRVSSVAAIAEAHRDFQANTKKAIESLKKVERKLERAELSLALSYIGASLTAVGVGVELGALLGVAGAIALAAPIGAVVFVGSLSLSITQLIINNDDKALGDLLINRVGDYIYFIGLSGATGDLMKAVSRSFSVFNIAKAIYDLDKSSDEKNKLENEVKELKATLKNMQEIDSYEKFQALYIGNCKRTISWLKMFKELTKDTDGRINQSQPTLMMH